MTTEREHGLGAEAELGLSFWSATSASLSLFSSPVKGSGLQGCVQMRETAGVEPGVEHSWRSAHRFPSLPAMELTPVLGSWTDFLGPLPSRTGLPGSRVQPSVRFHVHLPPTCHRD